MSPPPPEKNGPPGRPPAPHVQRAVQAVVRPLPAAPPRPASPPVPAAPAVQARLAVPAPIPPAAHVQRALGPPAVQAKRLPVPPPAPSRVAPPVQTPRAVAVVQRAGGGGGAPPPPPPAPVLTAVAVGASDQEGYCGNFQRVRRWNVANPVQGIIVQEVWRTFNVRRYDRLPRGGGWRERRLTGRFLNWYVRDRNSSVHASENHYWELWEVSAAGVVGDGGTDTFGLCSIIPWDGVSALNYQRHIQRTTTGTFTMRGSARFYPTTAAPGTYGFRQWAVQAAGGLYSTTRDPAARLPAASPGQVDYTVTVNWDSASRRNVYSRVT